MRADFVSRTVFAGFNCKQLGGRGSRYALFQEYVLLTKYLFVFNSLELFFVSTNVIVFLELNATLHT